MMTATRVQQLLYDGFVSVGFRPTEEDLRVIEANRRADEKTSDVIRRALRLLDREAWEERARADMHRLRSEDLSAEPDAWEYGRGCPAPGPQCRVQLYRLPPSVPEDECRWALLACSGAGRGLSTATTCITVRGLSGHDTAGWRWLDIRALSQRVVSGASRWQGAVISRVVYCTA